MLLVACSPWTAQLEFLYRPGPLVWGGTTLVSWVLPYQSSRKFTHRFTYLMEAFPHSKFPLGLACIKLTKTDRHNLHVNFRLTLDFLRHINTLGILLKWRCCFYRSWVLLEIFVFIASYLVRGYCSSMVCTTICRTNNTYNYYVIYLFKSL